MPTNPTTNPEAPKAKKSLTQVITETATSRAQEGSERGKEISKELVQLVIFDLEGEEYGVDIMDVREIMKKAQITPVPNSPQFIAGIVNVRGTIDVVVDLAKRFNLKTSKDAKREHIINVERGDNLYGMVVDEVTEVLRIPKDTIEPAPAIISQEIGADYVKGVAIVEDRLLILLDTEKVLDEKKLAQFSSVIHRKEAEVVTQKEEETTEKKEKKEEMTESEHDAKLNELVQEHVEKKTDSPEDAEEEEIEE